MARTILVTDSDLIDSWYNKVNTLSDYMGDLDDLDTTFQPGYTWSLGGYPIDRDSNLVSAIDYLGREAKDIYNSLIVGTSSSTRSVSMKLFIDSGDFDLIDVNQLWNYDSAMTLGPTDPTWYGDSPGTAGFDFTADSAKFRELNVLNLREYPDSATFGQLTITDSGYITNLTALDSTATVFFKSLRWKYQVGVIDSALVLQKINIIYFISDSAGDPGVVIDSAIMGTGDINTLTLTDSPDLGLMHARPFLIADSLGYDSIGQGDSGTIYFAAYQLDVDSV